MNPQNQDSSNQDVVTGVTNAPSQVTPSVPEFVPPSVGQPVAAPGAYAAAPNPKKSKKGLIIAAVLLLIILIAGAGYFLLTSKSDEGKNTPDSNQSASTEQQSNEAAKLITTTYTVYDQQNSNPVSVSFEHPEDWTVVHGEDSEVDDFKIKGGLTLTSRDGNSISFKDASYGGRGGGCQAIAEVELVKRLSIGSADYIFEELRHTENSEVLHSDSESKLAFRKVNKGASVEKLDRDAQASILALESMKEGDILKIDCNLISQFPDITKDGSSATISVYISSQDSGYAKYDSIKDDADFLKMIQSIELQ